MLHHLNPSGGCQPQDLQAPPPAERHAAVLRPSPATCVCEHALVWPHGGALRDAADGRRQTRTRGRRGRWTERRDEDTHSVDVLRTTRAWRFTARSSKPPLLHLHAAHSLSSHSTSTNWAIKAFFSRCCCYKVEFVKLIFFFVRLFPRFSPHNNYRAYEHNFER